MDIARRCLAISVLLLISIAVAAQGYITGYGVTPRAAIKDLSKAYVQVSTHSELVNRNGKSEFESVSGIDSGAYIPAEGIQLDSADGLWRAMIREDLLLPVKSEWKFVEETTVNTYNQQPFSRGGYVYTGSHSEITIRDHIISPSNRKTSRGERRMTVDTRKRLSNKGYGSTWTTTRYH